MKRFFILAAMLLLSTTVYAENQERIEALRQESDQLYRVREEALKSVKDLEIRLIEINGAIKELQRSDSVKEEEKKTELQAQK